MILSPAYVSRTDDTELMITKSGDQTTQTIHVVAKFFLMHAYTHKHRFPRLDKHTHTNTDAFTHARTISIDTKVLQYEDEDIIRLSMEIKMVGLYW